MGVIVDENAESKETTAMKMSQDELDKILAEHRKWLDNNNGCRADLTDADLTDADLTGANLRYANLHYAKLTGAILTKANLDDATLRHTDLTDANLTRARMIHTNLSDADLRGANLSRAIMIYTVLGGANLSHTDLKNADLTGAILTNTNLSNADLSGARISGTLFISTNLNGVNINKCSYRGSSGIDLSTLQKSGMLPLEFLRGCGLPDDYIDYLPSLLGKAIQFYDCFISYASKDHAFAEKLHSDLQGKGVRCWFAPHDLRIGAAVRSTIEEQIRIKDKLLVIFSKNSIDSDWVEHEVDTALAEEDKRKGYILFPIRIDDAIMEAKFGWAKNIRQADKPTGRHIGDFTRWKIHDQYSVALERLLRNLKPNADS